MNSKAYRSWAEIDQGALRHNAEVVRKRVGPDVELLAVVKANGYGHGMVSVAKALAQNAHFFGVANLEEATVLRGEVAQPIIILGPALPEERPLIAGVYQNRLTRKMVLNADPSLLYAHDMLQLKAMPIADWTSYAFWSPWGARFDQVQFPAELAGYQTYTHGGLMPSPICTPTAASIDAALKPDTKAGYLYFVAKNDGSHTHAFARTYAEHQANLRKYGYR